MVNRKAVMLCTSAPRLSSGPDPACGGTGYFLSKVDRNCHGARVEVLAGS